MSMTKGATVPVYGLQNDVIGFATPRNARRMREEGVVMVFTRDPFAVVVKDVASLSHPLTKEAVMAKRTQTAAKPATTTPQTPEQAQAQADHSTLDKIGAATEENPNPQHHQPITDAGINEATGMVPVKTATPKAAPKPAKAKAVAEATAEPVPANTGFDGIDLLAEAKKMTAGGSDADYDPKGFYISNRFADYTVIVGDIFLEEGKPNSALTWLPGEIKRMDTIGITAKRLLESTQFIASLKQGVLVQGRLDPKFLVRHGYWDGKPNPAEIVKNMATKEGSFTLEPNANNNWYLQKMLERVRQEEEINTMSAGEDELSSLQHRMDADKNIGTNTGNGME